MDEQCQGLRLVSTRHRLPRRVHISFSPYTKLLMLDNLNSYNIVLASNSPRRKELLERLGIKFKIRTLLGVDESFPKELQGAEVAKYISKKKADAYKETMGENDLIITADTIVCIDNQILGKPKNAAEAATMLGRLSGRTHEVITGVTVLSKSKCENFAVTSRVKFATLTEEEISYYINNFLPFDKAGAYGIQEWIGLIAVEELHGSFFNVMGLPVQRLYTALKTF